MASRAVSPFSDGLKIKWLNWSESNSETPYLTVAQSTHTGNLYRM